MGMQKWILRYTLLFCNIHSVLLMNCRKHLGGIQRYDVFFCDAINRVGADIVWMKNSVELVDDHKYDLSPTSLTINDIIHNDEGNYSCKYMTTSFQNATLDVGCLLVYGSAFFNPEEDQVAVNSKGMIQFNLSLTFSMAGSSGLMQEIIRFILINDSSMMPVVWCNAGFHNPCIFSGGDGSQWWTVEADEGHHVIYTFHQARSTDVGSYTALVEGSDPANNNIDSIQKKINCTAMECSENYPNIDGGRVVYLESPERDIVGSQVNYSCNGSCVLQGSNSLRCRVDLIDGQISSEWINDTGGAVRPSCSCHETAPYLLPSRTTLPVSNAGSISDPTVSLKIVESPTDNTASGERKENSSGLNAYATSAIVFGVIGFVILTIHLSFITAFLLIKRGKRKVMEYSTGKDVLDTEYKQDVAMRERMKAKGSRTTTTPEIPSVDNHNRDSYIETVVDELLIEHAKNSHEIYV